LVIAAGRFRLRVVLRCLLYRLLCCLVGVLARGGGERELEIVVLRHHLAILSRGGKRPRYTAVSPQTLRRWHRALLERGRRRQCRGPVRPPLPVEMRGLIRRLARENPRWVYMRIEGELLKLGISVSATTIATVLRSSGLGPAPRRIGPSWSEFLRAQAHSMLGGSPSSAAGDDAPADDASEPNGSPQLGPRSPDRKPATTSARGMPSSHLQLLIPCGAIRAGAPARSPRDPTAVAAAAVASIACSRRTQKSRPALVPQPSAQARCHSHSVPAHVRHQPRHRVPSGGREDLQPRHNRSTTSPSRIPEPSFFTPHAPGVERSPPQSRVRLPTCTCRRALYFWPSLTRLRT
jgi:hypothetical protein